MKPLWYAVSLMAGSLMFSSVAPAAPVQSGVLLQQMKQASQSLSYELAYINVSRLGIESVRYRHAIIDGTVYAQLLQMDGPRREIIQRGNEVSYFESGLEPFAMQGDHIVDSLPSLIYADFRQLATDYDFVSVGRTRIADQLCEAIRIVPRDGTRYGYIVWLDSESRLPLRVDLLDRDGETLEQYRVVSFAVDDGVGKMMQELKNAKFPAVLSLPKGNPVTFNWQVGWLPSGMKELSQSRRQLPTLNRPVESRLFSDGLFSFSVNVTLADKTSSPQLLRTGRRTMQTEVRNNAEITVVGELPPATAKRIADSITLGTAR
ncbi:sigma-E factor regulatory protein RseB [Erwinia pyrifoliae]|uniref:Sigma-E factor regulatory protein RseB n=1 Tax=Erwinia pyrifoliae TaxID=79967 RepID=A0ABY5XAE6_ERWPY|nr:sigma-E factor regulatory protein RseB [Erwinia pyrifoliae]AUX73445.1 sigma-E factor regulatory protein RseB [Erwinia pyrifoliae]MCA8876256.1 sigma-E factor regulatory protein RseB [Erwinia pyrifoliae]UWS28413.1 sigma-E factor regulatory protein RseB [Erwinia pyrifoliae]UWS34378.1 sigma-E factor regulatory protein RseB [Erwinia pyrifoliae]UXK11410.1 sigma-E factor regulatory protein RseB [Erwinia pyrifoliae]